MPFIYNINQNIPEINDAYQEMVNRARALAAQGQGRPALEAQPAVAVAPGRPAVPLRPARAAVAADPGFYEREVKYKGPRIAKSEDVKELSEANAKARAMQGQYQPGFDRASALLQQGAAPDFGARVNEFMNPYTQQVAERIRDMNLRALREQIMPAIEGKFTRLGQHGGTRHLAATERASRNLINEIMDKQAQVMAHGYDLASRQYGSQKERELHAAQQAAQMEPLRRGLALSDIAALTEQGRSAQSDKQRALDLEHQNFMAQQYYPWQQLFNQQALMQGLNAPAQEFLHQQTPPPQYGMNTAGNVGALATQMLGAGMRPNQSEMMRGMRHMASRFQTPHETPNWDITDFFS